MLRGPVNDLHRAIHHDAFDRARSLILGGNVDLDDADTSGSTPLIYAARKGLVPIMELLLRGGAGTSAMNDSGFSALHACAMNGNPRAMQLLVAHVADLEVRDHELGVTSLHVTAQEGHWQAAEVLVEAGASIDSVAFSGATALYMAASYGHCDAVCVLLRANANPLVACKKFSPLEAASFKNHAQVVHELIDHVGIEGCGGPSGGLLALNYAAQEQSLESMEILLEKGVVDTDGDALRTAVTYGREKSVLFLLRAYLPHASVHEYVNFRDATGSSALKCCFMESSLGLSSHRIYRWLIDSGADFFACFGHSPPCNSSFELRYKDHPGFEVTEEKDRSIEALRRVMLSTTAACSMPWGWGIDVSGYAGAVVASEEKNSAATRCDKHPTTIRWRRARGSSVPLALIRYSLQYSSIRSTETIVEMQYKIVAKVLVLF